MRRWLIIGVQSAPKTLVINTSHNSSILFGGLCTGPQSFSQTAISERGIPGHERAYRGIVPLQVSEEVKALQGRPEDDPRSPS